VRDPKLAAGLVLMWLLGAAFGFGAAVMYQHDNPLPPCERQHCEDVEIWQHYSESLEALHSGRPSK